MLDERIAARVSESEKQELEAAAERAGCTVSHLLREAALQRAEEILGDREVVRIVLSPEAARRLAAAAAVAEVEVERFARRAIAGAVQAKLGAEAATDAVESGMAQATEA